ARHIYETATRHGKRVQALGGAKNHMVVLPDADMDLAADAVVGAAYGSAGQRCMAISALISVGSAADDLVPPIVDRVERLKVGPAPDPAAEMGPVITRESCDRVICYIHQGVDQGADLVVDGRDLAIDAHENGFWVGPTLFDRVTPSMSVYTD